MSSNFITAEWRKLAIANYEVDPKVLQEYIPYKTELDLHKGVCYVSLVGFMFQNTRIKGVTVPFHSDFEEVNLRFYVRFKEGDKWNRGVVFIKEIVPKPALSFIANMVYKEHYQTLPMEHSWLTSADEIKVSYKWKQTQWNSIKVTAGPDPNPFEEGSLEGFITEHYWGFTKIDHKTTSAYEVEHPKWNMYPVKQCEINVDFHEQYGSEFASLSDTVPMSAFLAEGSKIAVGSGITIK